MHLVLLKNNEPQPLILRRIFRTLIVVFLITALLTASIAISMVRSAPTFQRELPPACYETENRSSKRCWEIWKKLQQTEGRL